MSAAEIAARHQELAIASCLEKLYSLFPRLEVHNDHEGRELLRHAIWDLMDVKVGVMG